MHFSREALSVHHSIEIASKIQANYVVTWLFIINVGVHLHRFLARLVYCASIMIAFISIRFLKEVLQGKFLYSVAYPAMIISINRCHIYFG